MIGYKIQAEDTKLFNLVQKVRKSLLQKVTFKVNSKDYDQPDVGVKNQLPSPYLRQKVVGDIGPQTTIKY